MTLNIYDDADEKAKMLHVRAQIENLLRAHDLCADVVIGGRGRCEVFTVLDASWSRVSLIELPDSAGYILRVRSKLADYKGDADAQRADLEHTVGMVSTFAQVKAQQGLQWLDAAAYFDSMVGAEPTPLTHEPKQ
jgi:hypothetical protein